MVLTEFFCCFAAGFLKSISIAGENIDHGGPEKRSFVIDEVLYV